MTEKTKHELELENSILRGKYVSLKKDIDKILNKKRFHGRTWLLKAMEMLKERKVLSMGEVRDKLNVTNSDEMKRIAEFSEGSSVIFEFPREKKFVHCGNKYSPLHDLRVHWNTDLKDNKVIMKDKIDNIFINDKTGKVDKESRDKMLDFIKKHFAEYVDVKNGGIVRKDYNGGIV